MVYTCFCPLHYRVSLLSCSGNILNSCDLHFTQILKQRIYSLAFFHIDEFFRCAAMNAQRSCVGPGDGMQRDLEKIQLSLNAAAGDFHLQPLVIKICSCWSSAFLWGVSPPAFPKVVSKAVREVVITCVYQSWNVTFSGCYQCLFYWCTEGESNQRFDWCSQASIFIFVFHVQWRIFLYHIAVHTCNVKRCGTSCFKGFWSPNPIFLLLTRCMCKDGPARFDSVSA